MGHDWRAYDGCLISQTPKRDWTTAIRLQKRGQCVAYGALAALESMLRIHYYNDSTKSIDLFNATIGSTVQNLDTFMGTNRSIDKVREALKDNGIMIQGRVEPYKIAGIYEILGISKKINDVPSKIKEAKKYLETNGPIIAMYTDSTVGSHCVAIVGYTTDNAGKTYWICKDSWPLKNNGAPYPNDTITTWNTDGTCKITGATGGYREIGAEDMLGDNGNGSLYAIKLRELKISIKHRASPPTSITDWWQVNFNIEKKIENVYVKLVDLDPTFVSRFAAINVDRCVAALEPSGRYLKITQKDGSTNRTLDNLMFDVDVGQYNIYVHVCANGNEDASATADVNDNTTPVPVTILLNIVNQCAKEILYPFALHAIEKQPSDDVKVAINALLRTAEISKEDFIKDLEQKLIDLHEAHNIGVERVQGTLRETKKILELVRSIED